jgi:tetratricopeptide (TPR) repeat protein
MPNPYRALGVAVAALAVIVFAAPAAAQNVRPLAPILEPADQAPSPSSDEETARIPLPLAASRAAAADRARPRVASVLPAAWSSIAERYQPLWDGAGAGTGFGLERWGPYFAAAGIVPSLAPHPFLSPWGMLSYEGWLFDRYRAAWEETADDAERHDLAAGWLQRGDRAIAEGRIDDAALAYRRVTQAAPEFPLGWLALGAALAESGADQEAAGALRQGLDRYPSWLAPALDWEALYGSADRLVGVQSATAERALAGSDDARFVAGVLHLFGGAPATGRRLLSGLVADPHARMLLGRGPH